MKQTLINFSRWNKWPVPSDHENAGGMEKSGLSESQDNGEAGSGPGRSPHSWTPGSSSTSSAANASSGPRLPPAQSSSTVEKYTTNVSSSNDIVDGNGPKAGQESSSFTSSQRVVRNGEHMVTNSDEDDDSSSSLIDIDEILRKHKPARPLKRTSEQSGISASTEQGQYQPVTRPRRQLAQGTRFRPPSPAKKRPEPRFSLSYLAEQRKKLDRADESVARTKGLLAAKEETQPEVSSGIRPTQKVLETVLNEYNDGDEVERLRNALRHTEALHHKPTWSFFRTNTGRSDEFLPDIPECGDHGLRRIMHNPVARKQAFLSGQMGQVLQPRGLELDLATWILNCVMVEPQEDLRIAYVRALVDVASSIRSLLTVDFLRMSLRRLGATDEALETKKPINPQFKQEKDNWNTDRPCLLTFLSLLQGLSHYIDGDVRIEALSLLCRLLIDLSITTNCNLALSIEATVIDLLEHTPEPWVHQQVCSVVISRETILINLGQMQPLFDDLQSSMQDPFFRSQLLDHLPTSTMKSASFRHQLAISFASGDHTGALKTSQPRPKDIHESLRALYLKIDSTTDYAHLTSLISILNICLDTGNPPPPPMTSDFRKEDEKKFNKEVDDLSAKLKELSAKIVDTGSLNMGRTEAKEAIDSFLRRLNYTVRTRPPPRKTIAGSSEVFDSERTGMAAWMETTTTKDLEGGADTVEDREKKDFSEV